VSGEGIVTLSVCVCVCVRQAATARHISLGGEGNVLYPVLSRFTFCLVIVQSCCVQVGCVFIFSDRYRIKLRLGFQLENCHICLESFVFFTGLLFWNYTRLGWFTEESVCKLLQISFLSPSQYCQSANSVFLKAF